MPDLEKTPDKKTVRVALAIGSFESQKRVSKTVLFSQRAKKSCMCDFLAQSYGRKVRAYT